MAHGDHDSAPLTLFGVDELVRLHAQKRLRLAFSVGLEGCALLADDPQALVTELLRLARIGAQAELQAGDYVSVRTLVRDAQRAWRNLDRR